MSITIIDDMTPSIKRIQKELAKIPQQAYEVFVKNTPIDRGNARKSTKLVKEVIQANYDYATRLDAGYSKQSPKGMSKPTGDFIKARAAKVMRK